MTEEQLKQSEAWAEMVHTGSEPAMFAVYVTVHDLTAEVRRLRGLIKAVEQTDNDFGTLFCPWCTWGGGPHADDCAAFTPTGEVR